MHRRMLAAACAAVLFHPTTVAAQLRPQEDVVLISGVRVSPFVGFLTPFKRAEEWAFVDGENTVFVQSEIDVGGGSALGVQLEAPLVGRFGVTGAAAYASRGDTDFAVLQTGDLFRVDGNHVLLGRLGAALHLHEAESELVLRQLGASVFAGAVVMHERPRERLGDVLTSGTHFGINMGANGEVPFGNNRFAVQIGVENNMMWWDEDALRPLAFAYFGGQGPQESTTVSAEVSNVFLLRAGLQFRF